MCKKFGWDEEELLELAWPGEEPKGENLEIFQKLKKTLSLICANKEC